MAITTDNTILYSTYVLSKRGHLFVFIVGIYLSTMYDYSGVEKKLTVNCRIQIPYLDF